MRGEQSDVGEQEAQWMPRKLQIQADTDRCVQLPTQTSPTWCLNDYNRDDRHFNTYSRYVTDTIVPLLEQRTKHCSRWRKHHQRVQTLPVLSIHQTRSNTVALHEPQPTTVIIMVDSCSQHLNSFSHPDVNMSKHATRHTPLQNQQCSLNHPIRPRVLTQPLYSPSAFSRTWNTQRKQNLQQTQYILRRKPR